MKIWSDSWGNGERIPERFAAVRPVPGGSRASDNLNPHLAWDELPGATRSLVLICHDFDGPASAAELERLQAEPGLDIARADFIHWVLVDLPPAPASIAEGEFSRRPHSPGKIALRGARQGRNDFSAPLLHALAQHLPSGCGQGYDGPLPAAFDSWVHHYVFTLYAVDLERLSLPEAFGGHEVRQAIAGHVLDAATWSGTYSLHAPVPPASPCS